MEEEGTEINAKSLPPSARERNRNADPSPLQALPRVSITVTSQDDTEVPVEEEGMEIPIIWSHKEAKKAASDKENMRNKTNGKLAIRNSVRSFLKRGKRAPLGHSNMEAAQSNSIVVKVAPPPTELGDSVVSAQGGHEQKDSSRRKLSTLFVAAASTKRIFGSKKPSESQGEKGTKSERTVSSVDETSVEKETRPLAEPVTDHEEEIEQEPVVTIESVLNDFGDEKVKRQLEQEREKQKEGMPNIYPLNITEAQLTALMDEVDGCRGCLEIEDFVACCHEADTDSITSRKADRSIEADAECSNDDIKKEDDSDGATFESDAEKPFPRGSSFSNALGMLLADNEVEDSFGGSLTLDDTLNTFDNSLLGEYDDETITALEDDTILTFDDAGITSEYDPNISMMKNIQTEEKGAMSGQGLTPTMVEV